MCGVPEVNLPFAMLQLLAHVSDGMAFGALEPCPECKGQLRFQ